MVDRYFIRELDGTAFQPNLVSYFCIHMSYVSKSCGNFSQSLFYINKSIYSLTEPGAPQGDCLYSSRNQKFRLAKFHLHT